MTVLSPLSFIQLVTMLIHHTFLISIFIITFLWTIGNVWFDYPQVNKVGCFNHHVVHELQALGEQLVDDDEYGSSVDDIDDWLIMIMVMLVMVSMMLVMVAMIVQMYAIPYINTIVNSMVHQIIQFLLDLTGITLSRMEGNCYNYNYNHFITIIIDIY